MDGESDERVGVAACAAGRGVECNERTEATRTAAPPGCGGRWRWAAMAWRDRSSARLLATETSEPAAAAAVACRSPLLFELLDTQPVGARAAAQPLHLLLPQGQQRRLCLARRARPGRIGLRRLRCSERRIQLRP